MDLICVFCKDSFKENEVRKIIIGHRNDVKTAWLIDHCAVVINYNYHMVFVYSCPKPECFDANMQIVMENEVNYLLSR